MKQALTALIFVVLPSMAWADEIDYFCIFSSAAAAQTDSVVGSYWHATAWDQSVTIDSASPNTLLKVTTPAALINGISPITGFWIIVASIGPNAALHAYVQAGTPCVMELDRDLAPGGAFVVGASISGINRTSLTFAPVPMGAKYPQPLGK